MPIVVSCECGKSFTARDEHAGKTARCPACQRSLTIHSFAMIVEQVMDPEGGGAVLACGLIGRGSCRTGDEVAILSAGAEVCRSIIADLQVLNKPPGYAVAGDQVAMRLESISAEYVQQGMEVAGLAIQSELPPEIAPAAPAAPPPPKPPKTSPGPALRPWPAAAAAPIASAVSAAPLGREPAAASYGLLLAVACGFLILGVIFSGWHLHKTLNPQVVRLPFGFQPPKPAASTFETLKALLGLAQSLLAGLTMMWVVNSITRLDKYANWIVWRSEGLSKPIGEPLGSSLPYILPWTVCGGLLVIMGVGFQSGGAGDMMMSQFLPGNSLALVAIGGLLFLTGLGCGEIRRFYWRMAQAGLAIPRRKRGGEISIGPPARVGGGETHTASPMFMTLALVALACGYGILTLPTLPKIIDNINIEAGSVTAATRTAVIREAWSALAMFATLTLGIVGGGYTLHLLGGLWGELVQSWNRAAHSIALPKRPYFGEIGTQGFSASAWTIGGAVLVLDLYLVMKILDAANAVSGRRGGGDGVFPALIASLCFPACAVLFMWWLGALKRDSHRFVQATSVVPRSHEEVNQSGGLRIAAIGLLCVLGAQTIMLLYQMYQILETFSKIRGSGAEFVAGALMGVLLVVGLVLLPLFWLALVALDLDRAASNLQVCHEVRS